MSTTHPITGSAPARLLAALFAAALALALVPLHAAHADGHYPGRDDRDTLPEGEVFDLPAEPGEMIAAKRYSGVHRIATAAHIALENFPEGSEVAIVARSDDWPDALAASFAAGLEGAPVILVETNAVTDNAAAALEELGVQEILLLGGTAAISAAVQAELEQDYDVDRVFGPTRVETAANLALEYHAGDPDQIGSFNDRRTAIIATSEEFADALAMGPIATSQNFPILLTGPDGLHPATAEALAELDIEQVLVAGGTGRIPNAVVQEVHEIIGEEADRVERLFGTTRVDTAAEIALFSVEMFGFGVDEHGWATGSRFPDALAIGPVLGQMDPPAPVLLTQTPTIADSGENSNQNLAEAVACSVFSIQIAGGVAAISQETANEIRGWFVCPDVVELQLSASDDVSEPNEDVTLTALAIDNTGGPVEGVTVTFEVENETAGADVEFTPANAEGVTDENGEATVEVTSTQPAAVEFIASTELEDETVITSNTVTVVFTGDLDDLSDLPQTGTFVLALSSEHEVGPGTAVEADPAFIGGGTIITDDESGAICWSVVIDLDSGDPQDPGSFAAWAAGAGIPAGHIHEGADDETGPIVVILGTPDDDTGVTVGCTFVDTDLVDEIQGAPEEFYANFHTDIYPGGIVRDQLAP